MSLPLLLTTFFAEDKNYFLNDSNYPNGLLIGLNRSDLNLPNCTILGS